MTQNSEKNTKTLGFHEISWTFPRQKPVNVMDHVTPV